MGGFLLCGQNMLYSPKMVFLVNKTNELTLDNHLTKYQYFKTGDGCYVRQKYSDRDFPIYRLIVSDDQMHHNILFTLTLETVPEKREIKEEMIVFQKGTVIQEELARITSSLI